MLVHLGSRGNAVDGHEEELLRLDLAEQMLYVVEDGDEHLVLGQSKGRRIGILVRAVMNDAIHIQLRQKPVSRCPWERPWQSATYIEAIELWYPVLRDELRDGRIPFAQPSEEFWDSHASQAMRYEVMMSIGMYKLKRCSNPVSSTTLSDGSKRFTLFDGVVVRVPAEIRLCDEPDPVG